MRSVPQSEVADRPFLWTRGVAASETLRYLDKNGVDVEAILSKAQLSRVSYPRNPAAYLSRHSIGS